MEKKQNDEMFRMQKGSNFLDDLEITQLSARVHEFHSSQRITDNEFNALHKLSSIHPATVNAFLRTRVNRKIISLSSATPERKTTINELTKPQTQMKRTTTYNKEDVSSLVSALYAANQITQVELKAYKALSLSSPNEVYLVLSQRTFKLGFDYLQKKAPNVLSIINKNSPTLLSVLKTQYVMELSATPKFNIGIRSGDITREQLLQLIWSLEMSSNDLTLEAALFSAHDIELYRDIIDYDDSNKVLLAVERDILEVFFEFTYERFKKEASWVLDYYIKDNYPKWHEKIMQPRVDEMKNKLK